MTSQGNIIFHSSIFEMCTECKGKGTLVTVNRSVMPFKPKMSVKTCVWCRGTGKVEIGDYRKEEEI